MKGKVLGGAQGWLQPLVHLTNNPISFIGVFLVTTAGVAWLFTLPVIMRDAGHPYLGILFFGILPAAFILGLLLIPLGIWLRLRGERKRDQVPALFPPLTWENADFRRLVQFVGIATFANVIIGGYYTTAAMNYMETKQFCGATCHVMNPEYTAYVDSPHASVRCVDCHIGEGTAAYVQAKWRGMGQVVQTITNNITRPIPAPVETMRSAADTCDNCHWDEFEGEDTLLLWDQYEEDETNTKTKTAVLLHQGPTPVTQGNHGFHNKPGMKIEYATDEKRETIPWIRQTNPDGTVIEYATDDWADADQSTYQIREMDCMDCHNRPAHQYQPPERALETAISKGEVDPSLPWVNKQGMEILQAGYETSEQAAERIPAALEEFYQNEHPDIWSSRQDDVKRSAQALLAVYQRNVFPEMDIDWGTYPSDLGHEYSMGCFRCHDDVHTATDGSEKTVPSDCSICHDVLAWEEADSEVLSMIGIQ